MLNFLRISALNGLNLVSDRQGMTARVKVDESDLVEPELVKQGYAAALEIFDEFIPPELRLAKLDDHVDIAKFAVDRFVASCISMQKAVGSNVDVRQFIHRSQEDVWDIFFEYEYELTGRNVCQYVFYIHRKILAFQSAQVSLDELKEYVRNRLEEAKKRYLLVSLRKEERSILKAAEDRGIPWRQLPDTLQFTQVGYGRNLKTFNENILDTENHSTFKLTNDKVLTSSVISELGLPVAQNLRVYSFDQVEKFVEQVGFPVVIKPLVGTQGTGVTPNIRTKEKLREAYEYATQHHNVALVEKHVEGDDYRLLVFGGKFVGCIKREVTVLTGDGKTTIKEFCDELNKQYWRNMVYASPKYQIKQSDFITEFLKEQGFTWDTVLEKGQQARMHVVPNISQGGTVSTIWDGIHPDNITMAERAAEALNLKLGGVDYLTTDISKPYWESGGVICEVNAKPAFDLMFDSDPEHLNRLGKIAFEICCPPGTKMEIPVVVSVSVPSSIMKELHQWMASKGVTVGAKYKQGSSIGTSPKIHESNQTSALNSVLWNPSVDAVLIAETVERVQRYGLEYSHCSHVLVHKMPMIQGALADRYLNILLKTVDHKMIINSENAELVAWAKEANSDKIVLAKGSEMLAAIQGELVHLFPEDYG